MSRRMMLMKTERLPAGYKRCLYLESTGTQYIDTEYIPNDASGFKLTVFCDERTDHIQFGCNTLYGSNSRWCCNMSGNNFYLSWNSPKNVKSGYDSSYIFTNYLNYKDSREVHAEYADGIYGPSTITQTLVTGTNAAIMFAGKGWASGGGISYYAKCKIYDLEITEGTDIVHHYVPCLDDLGEPCMYDLIEKETLYNGGTGSLEYELKKEANENRIIYPRTLNSWSVGETRTCLLLNIAHDTEYDIGYGSFAFSTWLTLLLNSNTIVLGGADDDWPSYKICLDPDEVTHMDKYEITKVDSNNGFTVKSVDKGTYLTATENTWSATSSDAATLYFEDGLTFQEDTYQTTYAAKCGYNSFSDIPYFYGAKCGSSYLKHDSYCSWDSYNALYYTWTSRLSSYASWMIVELR